MCIRDRTCDTLVVGGGVMGLNIAYQLKRRDPAHEVTVLEAAPALGAGSSGYSTGFQRAYYSFDETMGFALDSINAHKNWQDYMADTSAVAKFVEMGALWMLGYDEAQNAAMVERLAKFGVGADVLDEAAMGERLCGNQISGAPHHRRDVVSVAASARWRGVSTPSPRRCSRNNLCSMALKSAKSTKFRRLRGRHRGAEK